MNTPKNEPSEAVKQTKGNSKKWEDRELIQYAKKIAQNMSWLSVIIDVLALLPLPQGTPTPATPSPLPFAAPTSHHPYSPPPSATDPLLQALALKLCLSASLNRVSSTQLTDDPPVSNSPTSEADNTNVLPKGRLRICGTQNVCECVSSRSICSKNFSNSPVGQGERSYVRFSPKTNLNHIVLGVFWYFFSIQRETSCWHEACVKLSVACEDTFCIGCKDTLYCDSGNITARYIITPHKPCPLNTLYGGSTKGRNIIRQLNESCPLSMLDDRNTTARNIIKHLNGSCPLNSPDDALSPFNFGIFLDSLKNENPDQKLGKKFVYSFWWGLRNLSNFGTNLVTSTYAWENLFAILISVIGLLLFIYLIGNVEIPKLKDMDEKVLTMICDYLKPATYVENSFVFRTGDPLDCMLLIIEGTMWTYESSDSHAGQGISSMAIKPLRKGDFYGEELLNCASHCFTEVPVSSKHVKSQTKVEAFLLMAKDLETVLDKFNNREEVEEVEEVEKVARSTFCCFRTNAQRRPTPSLAEIGDDNGEVLPAGN
ncbi:unnamed protein product [Malus baccata var. baccata]